VLHPGTVRGKFLLFPSTNVVPIPDCQTSSPFPSYPRHIHHNCANILSRLRPERCYIIYSATLSPFSDRHRVCARRRNAIVATASGATSSNSKYPCHRSEETLGAGGPRSVDATAHVFKSDSAAILGSRSMALVREFGKSMVRVPDSTSELLRDLLFAAEPFIMGPIFSNEWIQQHTANETKVIGRRRIKLPPNNNAWQISTSFCGYCIIEPSSSSGLSQ
jgi:hypothetical protein